MKKILVTGASGFVGRNIFEALSARRDLEVHGTFRTRGFMASTKLRQADLAKAEEVSKIILYIQPDILIHAAAVTAGGLEVAKNPEAYLGDNVIMNTLLATLAHQFEIPECIFFGCAIAYPLEDRLVKEEDIDYDGRSNPYPKYRRFAEVKVAMEKFCRIYSELGKTRFTVIRHSNMYGPYDKFEGGGHFFPTMLAEVCKAENGSPIVMGAGTERRDLLHISDLVHFVKLVIDNTKDYSFDVFNAGLGVSYSLREVAEKIIEISGKQILLVQDSSRSVLPTQPALDSTRAREKFGWSPRVSLEEGIRMTMEWYSAHNASR